MQPFASACKARAFRRHEIAGWTGSAASTVQGCRRVSAPRRPRSHRRGRHRLGRHTAATRRNVRKRSEAGYDADLYDRRNRTTSICRAHPGHKTADGPFRAQGALSYRRDRVRLDKVAFTVAGSNGTITTDSHYPSVRPSARCRTSSMFAPAARSAAIGSRRAELRRREPEVRSSRKGSVESRHLGLRFPAFRYAGGIPQHTGHVRSCAGLFCDRDDVQARTANLAAAGRLFGVTLPAQPLDFAATISGTLNSFKMRQLTGISAERIFQAALAWT